jgi:hypothetical protein
MNCNNFGNYFKIIGHQREVKQDDDGFIINSSHYPTNACYRGKPPHLIGETFRYSEAIDILIPEDFVIWQQRRFIKKVGETFIVSTLHSGGIK